MSTHYRVLSGLFLPLALGASSLVWSAGAEVPVIAISSQGTSNANSAEANDASALFLLPHHITTALA